MTKVFDTACEKGRLDDAIRHCTDLRYQQKLTRMKDICLNAVHEICLSQHHKTFDPYEVQTHGALEDPGGVYGVVVRTRVRDGGKFLFLCYEILLRVIDSIVSNLFWDLKILYAPSSSSSVLLDLIKLEGRIVSHGLYRYLIKYGMSLNCFMRIMSEGFEPRDFTFAFKMVSRDHLRRLIPDKYVDAIQELRLPGIVHHKDHLENEKDVIRMQIYEGYRTVTQETD